MPTFHKGTGLMRIKLVPNKPETRIWARLYAPVFVTDPLLVTLELAENESQIGRTTYGIEKDEKLFQSTYGVDIRDAWHPWAVVTRYVLDGRIDETVVTRNGIGEIPMKQNFGMAISIPTNHITPDRARRFHYVAFMVTRQTPKRLFGETSIYLKHMIVTQMGDNLTERVVEHQYPLLGEKHEE